MPNSIHELELEIARLRKLGRTKRKPVAGIGGRIQKLREERSLGLAELAARAGISKGLLSTIECTRDANPQWHTLRALCNGMGIKIVELVS